MPFLKLESGQELIRTNLEKDLGDVSFRMHFQIKSDGNIHTSEGIELKVVDRQFERIEGD